MENVIEGNRELWEFDFEMHLTNSMWINKQTVDRIIAYMKENHSIIVKIKDQTIQFQEKYHHP